MRFWLGLGMGVLLGLAGGITYERRGLESFWTPDRLAGEAKSMADGASKSIQKMNRWLAAATSSETAEAAKIRESTANATKHIRDYQKWMSERAKATPSKP